MSTLECAVILARGLGTRMRNSQASGLSAEQAAAAAAGAKAMMPTAGRPFLDHVINALADAGVRDVCLVIGPEHQQVRDYYDALPTQRVRIGYAIQARPLGTADAVAAAEEYVAGRRFVMVNGDNLYAPDAVARLAEVEGTALLGYDPVALVEHSNIPAERIAAFALIEHAGGRLTGIVEKPSPAQVAAAGADALVSMNCFAFTADVFAACRHLEPSARGEYEIVDAVRALARTQRVTVVPVRSGVYDLSRRDDVAAVEAVLRDRPVHL